MSSKFNLKKASGTFLLGSAIAGVAGSGVSMARTTAAAGSAVADASKQASGSILSKMKNGLAEIKNSFSSGLDKFRNSERLKNVAEYAKEKFSSGVNLAKAHPYAATAIGAGVLAMTIGVIYWACSSNNDQKESTDRVAYIP